MQLLIHVCSWGIFIPSTIMYFLEGFCANSWQKPSPLNWKPPWVSFTLMGPFSSLINWFSGLFQKAFSGGWFKNLLDWVFFIESWSSRSRPREFSWGLYRTQFVKQNQIRLPPSPGMQCDSDYSNLSDAFLGNEIPDFVISDDGPGKGVTFSPVSPLEASSFSVFLSLNVVIGVEILHPLCFGVVGWFFPAICKVIVSSSKLLFRVLPMFLYSSYLGSIHVMLVFVGCIVIGFVAILSLILLEAFNDILLILGASSNGVPDVGKFSVCIVGPVKNYAIDALIRKATIFCISVVLSHFMDCDVVAYQKRSIMPTIFRELGSSKGVTVTVGDVVQIDGGGQMVGSLVSDNVVATQVILDSGVAAGFANDHVVRIEKSRSRMEIKLFWLVICREILVGDSDGPLADGHITGLKMGLGSEMDSFSVGGVGLKVKPFSELDDKSDAVPITLISSTYGDCNVEGAIDPLVVVSDKEEGDCSIEFVFGDSILSLKKCKAGTIIDLFDLEVGSDVVGYDVKENYHDVSTLLKWSSMFYSLIYSSVPPFVMGIFSMSLRHKSLMQFPKIYLEGLRYESFIMKFICLTMIGTLWLSLVLLFFASVFIYNDGTVDFWYFAVVINETQILVKMHVVMIFIALFASVVTFEIGSSPALLDITIATGTSAREAFSAPNDIASSMSGIFVYFKLAEITSSSCGLLELFIPKNLVLFKPIDSVIMLGSSEDAFSISVVVPVNCTPPAPCGHVIVSKFKFVILVSIVIPVMEVIVCRLIGPEDGSSVPSSVSIGLKLTDLPSSFSVLMPTILCKNDNGLTDVVVILNDSSPFLAASKQGSLNLELAGECDVFVIGVMLGFDKSWFMFDSQVSSKESYMLLWFTCPNISCSEIIVGAHSELPQLL